MVKYQNSPIEDNTNFSKFAKLTFPNKSIYASPVASEWYDPQNSGKFFEKRNPDDIGITIAFCDADDNQKSIEDISLHLGRRNTEGLVASFSMIITANKLSFQHNLSGILEEKPLIDICVFDKLGGYIDYVAISGSGAVSVSGFQFGNGWVTDKDNYGFVNMETIHGYAEGFVGSPLFTNGNINFGSGANTTWTSKALAWDAETGAAMRGSFSCGGFLGLQAWDNLTFTFGSFERVPAVPEPATLLVLGVAGLGGLGYRRWRKR